MKYRYTCTFEASSDDEATKVVYGDAENGVEGANANFESIHDERLEREDGTRV